MKYWRRWAHFMPLYLASVIRREWQLAVLALVGLAPGVAALTAWVQLALHVQAYEAGLDRHTWLLPPLLLALIGPQGVLVGAGVVTLLIGGLGLANAYLASVERRSEELALLRGLGLRRGELAGLLLVEALAAGLLGSGVGVLLGLALGWLSWPSAQHYFQLLPSYRPLPLALLVGLASGLLAALLFMGISVLALMVMGSLSLLRRSGRPPLLQGAQAGVTAVCGTLFAGLLTLAAALPVLAPGAVAVLTGLALALSALLSGGGWLLTQLFLRLPTPRHAPLWTLAVQALARHPRHTAGMTLALTTASYGVGLASLAWLSGGSAPAFPYWVAATVLVAGASLVFTAAALAALERRLEFGLLAALGARPGRIRRLILLEYGIVAVGGGSLGALMALVNWALVTGGGNWTMALAIVAADLAAALLSAWIGAAPVLWRVSRRQPGAALRRQQEGGRPLGA